jgi:tetratricopeptide (TPR) repeat protein
MLRALQETAALRDLLAVVPVVYLSVFIHELGHAVAGRLSGYTIGSFGVGLGRPLWVLNWRGTRVFFCRRRPLQGITFSVFPGIIPSPGRKAALLAGGVLANGLAFAAGLALARLLPWGHAVWVMLAWVNGLFVAVNLVPIVSPVGAFTLPSDGANILELLRGVTREAPGPARVRMVGELRGLWEAVGDSLTLHSFLLTAALDWAAWGDVEQADKLYAEAGSLALPDASWTAYRSVIGAVLAAEAGDAETACRRLGQADDTYQLLRHQPGLLLIALAKAAVLRCQGRPEDAAAKLQSLAHDPLVVAHAGLRMLLLAERLITEASRASPGAVELLRAEYETARRGHASPNGDLKVYRTLARYYRRRGERPEAELAYREVVDVVHRLYDAWTDRTTQARFLESQKALLAEAGDCLRAGGKAEEAEKVPLLFRPPAEGQGWHELARRRRNSIGWCLMALNFALGSAVLPQLLPAASRQQGGWINLGSLRLPPRSFASELTFEYTLPSVTAFPAALAVIAVRSLRPGWRRQRPKWPLLLGVLPYLTVLAWTLLRLVGAPGLP